MDKNLKKVFEKAVEDNYWADSDSLSGPGSNLTQTRVIRNEIPKLLENYKIKNMLDAPCGDMFWMKEILPHILKMGISYNGADIVPAIIAKNKSEFTNNAIKFFNLDLTQDKIFNVDLVLTRDCFIHLSYNNIYKILKNYQRSNIKYILVSTYTNSSRTNYDVNGFFLWGRMLNMEKFPFNFPSPIEVILEGCTEGQNLEFADKSLGLWKVKDLPLNYFKLNIIFNIAIKYFNNYLKIFPTLKNKMQYFIKFIFNK